MEGLEGAGGAPGREESCELEHALHASPRASRSRRYARAAAQRERVLERPSPRPGQPAFFLRAPCRGTGERLYSGTCGRTEQDPEGSWLSSPERGAGPMSLASAETPRTTPWKDARCWAGPQLCYYLHWISYKTISTPRDPELSASTARRTEEQFRGPLAACHPCPRASAARWEEAPWVTRASCPHFLPAPGSRAAVQQPQIPLHSVFSRLINPIIVTVMMRWHTVQLDHAFCIIDVQLASQRRLLVTTLFDCVALKLHVPLVPTPGGRPVSGSSCLGPGEPAVGRPSAEHEQAGSLGAGLLGKTGRRGPFNILKLGRGTRPPAIPSRPLPPWAGPCCPQGSAMLCLHAQGARRLCFVGLRDTKFQRLLCARLVTPAVTLDPRQSYKAGVTVLVL